MACMLTSHRFWPFVDVSYVGAVALLRGSRLDVSCWLVRSQSESTKDRVRRKVLGVKEKVQLYLLVSVRRSLRLARKGERAGSFCEVIYTSSISELWL